MQHPHRTDWDTPPDGDFASYVERLTRTPPAARAAASTPARPARPATRTAARPVSAASAASAKVQQPLDGPSLRNLAVAARTVLVVLLAVHAAAWFVFGWGSFVLLALTGGAWWLLGQALPFLGGPKVALPSALQPVLDALRDAARQPPSPRK